MKNKFLSIKDALLGVLVVGYSLNAHAEEQFYYRHCDVDKNVTRMSCMNTKSMIGPQSRFGQTPEEKKLLDKYYQQGKYHPSTEKGQKRANKLSSPETKDKEIQKRAKLADKVSKISPEVHKKYLDDAKAAGKGDLKQLIKN